MPLPRQDPDTSLINWSAERLEENWEPLAARLETLEGPQRRLALWLIVAEGLALFEYRLDDKIAGLRLLAFGLDSHYDDPSPQVIAYVLPEALKDNRRRLLGPLAVRGENGDVEHIELAVEPWELTLHAPLNLLYGTLCCWVRPKAGGEGVVTVSHAVASGRVYLDDGSVQQVLWYAPNCLDAAVADAPTGRNLSPLPAVVPGAGDAVHVMAKGGAQARTVKEVGQTYGTITAAIPHYFLIDRPLQNGDSGSLVRLSGGGGDALGLYVGSLATSGGARGLCQGLYQLDRLFTAAGQSSGLYEE